MKLSMWMVFDAIAPYIRRHNLDEASSERCVSGALPYLPARALSDDHIYVISAYDAHRLTVDTRMFQVIFGAAAADPIQMNCQYILLEPGLSFQQALSIVLEAFEKYNHWYDKLQQELTGVPDLMRICGIGYELLENPILLFAPDHVLVASADIDHSSGSSVLEKKSGSTLALSDEAYKAIVSRPGHEDDLQTDKVSFMENPLGYGNILYVNILCRQLEYRLCVNDNNRGIRNGDFQLCKILSEALKTALQMEHSKADSSKAALYELFQNIICSRAVEIQSCDDTLAAWDWRRRDSYLCLCMEKTNQNQRFVSNDQYICSKVEELLADACAFMHEGRLVCIVRLTPGLSDADIPARLESFLRDNIFTVGISDAFGDAVLAAHYYKEACIAISAGRAEQSSRLFHSFSDHSLTHLFRHGFDGLPPECYCDRSVRQLMALQDSKVDYFETLST